MSSRRYLPVFTTVCLALVGLLSIGVGSALAAGPMVEGLSGSAATPFAARLEAVVYPEGEATSCVFSYGTSTAYGTEVACEQGASIEGEPQFVGVSLAGLASGTTYDYKLTVKNGAGEVVSPGEFVTPVAEKPAVGSEAVSGATLTSTDVMLEAKVNPNYQETSYSFEYATSAAVLGTPGAITVPGAPPATALPAVFEEQLAGPVDLGGALTPGETYFYRVVATNNTGTTDGAPQSFQALDLPVPVTGGASEVTGSSALLAGTVNPAGAPTSYYFAYIDQAGYQAALGEGAAAPYARGGSTPEGTTNSAYTPGPTNPLSASNLRPGTTYHYALVASNSVGTVTGADETFTTPAGTSRPLASTGGALGITSGTATITGSVETQGLPSSAAFEFGSTPGLGSTEGASQLPGAGGSTPVAFAFNGYLSPGTTYYYRVVVTNAQGTSYGAVRSFTTVASPSAALSPVTPLLSVPGEATPTPAKPAPAAKCKKGTRSKKGKCTKHKAKPKKQKAKGKKSSHSGEKRGN